MKLDLLVSTDADSLPLDVERQVDAALPVLGPNGSGDANNERDKVGTQNRERKRERRHRATKFASTLFFVVGGVLHLFVAVVDFGFANGLLDPSAWLRTADYDVVRANYRLEERYNASLSLSEGREEAISTAAASRAGGARRMKTRQLQSSLDEEKSRAEAASGAAGQHESPGVRRTEERDPGATRRTKKEDRKGGEKGEDEKSKKKGKKPKLSEKILYHGEDWTDLPTKIRNAYITLGYDEDLWKSGQRSLPRGSLKWAELTDERREAALLVGYTEELWDIMIEVENMAPASDIAPNQAPAPQNADGPAKLPAREPSPEGMAAPLATIRPISAPPAVTTPTYAASRWFDLTTDERHALLLLGYTETLWNDGETTPADRRAWNELSDAERYGASSLGYDPESWDAATPGGRLGSALDATPANGVANLADEVSGSSALYSRPQVEWQMEELTFETNATDITARCNSTNAVNDTSQTTKTVPTAVSAPEANIRPSLEASSSVAVDTDPETAHTSSTAELNHDQFWVDSPPEIHESHAASPTPKQLYHDEYWQKLPSDIQDAYAVLGYENVTWNEGIVPEPSNVYWDDLPPQMKEAALSIGYTRATWDDIESDPATSARVSQIVVASPTSAAVAEVGVVTAPTSPAVIEATSSAPVTSFLLKPDLSPSSPDVAKADPALTIGTIGATSVSMEVLHPEPDPSPSPSSFDAAEVKLAPVEATRPKPNAVPITPSSASTIVSPSEGYEDRSWYDVVDPVTGDAVKEANDDFVSYDDDDYMFQVGFSNARVSRRQTLCLAAALSFLIVGALDLIRERRAFHVLMILAGFFGVVSALCIEELIRLSNILNCISVHLYWLEAVTLFKEHRRGAIAEESDAWIVRTTAFGDSAFVTGTMIDVILSYIILLDHTSDRGASLMIASIVAAVLWLFCSLAYMGAFAYDCHKRRKNDAIINNVATTESSEDDESDSPNGEKDGHSPFARCRSRFDRLESVSRDIENSIPKYREPSRKVNKIHFKKTTP